MIHTVQARVHRVIQGLDVRVESIRTHTDRAEYLFHGSTLLGAIWCRARRDGVYAVTSRGDTCRLIDQPKTLSYHYLRDWVVRQHKEAEA